MTKQKKDESLNKLIEQARNDPKFFHSLVFDPENTISTLDYLDRSEKAMLVSLNPKDVISGLIGLIRNPGFGTGSGFGICGITCVDSCDNTCGAGSCYGTCLSGTCDLTCGARSCDITVELIGRQRFGGLARNDAPEAQGYFQPRRRFG